jgi:hypothetical protein
MRVLVVVVRKTTLPSVWMAVPMLRATANES